MIDARAKFSDIAKMDLAGKTRMYWVVGSVYEGRIEGIRPPSTTSAMKALRVTAEHLGPDRTRLKHHIASLLDDIIKQENPKSRSKREAVILRPTFVVRA